MTDGVVQVQPDGAGKKVDASELVRDDGTIVERQRAVIGDGDNPLPSGVSEVRDKKIQVEDRTLQILEHMSKTLDKINFMLCAITGADDAD